MTIFLPSLFVFFSQSFGIRSRDLSWKRAFAVGATKNCVSYIQTTLWTTGNWRKIFQCCLSSLKRICTKSCANFFIFFNICFCSHDGQYVISGSEDHFVYIWRTQHGFPSSRRDKNEFYLSFSGKISN